MLDIGGIFASLSGVATYATKRKSGTEVTDATFWMDKVSNAIWEIYSATKPALSKRGDR
jgi:hypothetical protein